MITFTQAIISQGAIPMPVALCIIVDSIANTMVTGKIHFSQEDDTWSSEDFIFVTSRNGYNVLYKRFTTTTAGFVKVEIDTPLVGIRSISEIQLLTAGEKKA